MTWPDDTKAPLDLRVEAATLERAAEVADGAMPDDEWYALEAGRAIRALSK